MSLYEEIDALCDQWAEQWQLHSYPDLREFLTTVDSTLRAAAVPFLIPMDLGFRRVKCPDLTPDEYAWLGNEAIAVAQRSIPASSEAATQGQDSSDLNPAIRRLWDFASAPRDSYPTAGDSDSSAIELQNLPTDVGEYRVLELIGGGGQGVVARGIHRITGEAAAIKFIRPELATSLPVRRRFLRESTIARSISHPNVVQFISVEESPQLCLVMEFVTGRTLEAWIRERGVLPLPLILRLGIQVASGLQAAHLAGIIHRDLKPLNILLQDGEQPTAKISDFGVARFAGDPGITRSGTIVGSAAWLSPEQAQEQKATEQSDIFSLGSVLYCMACGQSPFQRPTLMATLNAIVEDAEVGVTAIRSDLPEEFCGLLRDMLQKRPERRTPSAAEVARRLRTLALISGVTVEELNAQEQNTTHRSQCSHRETVSSFRRPLALSGLAVLTGLAMLRSFEWRPPRGDVEASDGPSRTIASVSAEFVKTSPNRRLADALALPCTPEALKEKQAVWATHLRVPSEFRGPAGIRFILIPSIQITRNEQRTMDEEFEQHESVVDGRPSEQSGNHSALTTTAPFFAAVHPVDWQQYRTLLDGEIVGGLMARLSNGNDSGSTSISGADAIAELTMAQTTEVIQRLRLGLEESSFRHPAGPSAPSWNITAVLPQPKEWCVLSSLLQQIDRRAEAWEDPKQQMVRISQSAVVSGLSPSLRRSEGTGLLDQRDRLTKVNGWVQLKEDQTVPYSVQRNQLVISAAPVISPVNARKTPATAGPPVAVVWPVIRIPADDSI